jgi:hypothetical protein
MKHFGETFYSRECYKRHIHYKEQGNMTEIHSKTQIISSLEASAQRAQAWFKELPADHFFTRQAETWSPPDNVDHMIRAIKPITKALKLPKRALQTLFGKPANASRSYEEICRIYGDEIAKGAKASGTFLPRQETPDHVKEKKEELLHQLSTELNKLISTVKKWEEHELDEAQLPHPIIGKITLREMLFFTIHHNLRHASQEGD